MARGAPNALRPDPEHVGFRINALASLLPACAWGKLAAKFEAARNDPSLMRVFVNTDLGQPYEEAGEQVDGSALAARAEPFSLTAIPPEVLTLTCGVDCQDDRLEPVITGWGRDGTCYVLHGGENARLIGSPWMWTLAFGHHEDRTPTHGYEATREAAMAAFAKSWRRE